MSADMKEEGFRKEYLNAMIALVTEALQEIPGDPAYVAAIRRVIDEVPLRSQVALAGYLTAMVVGELALAQGRTRGEVWGEIALRAAVAFPENE